MTNEKRRRYYRKRRMVRHYQNDVKAIDAAMSHAMEKVMLLGELLCEIRNPHLKRRNGRPRNYERRRPS